MSAITRPYSAAINLIRRLRHISRPQYARASIWSSLQKIIRDWSVINSRRAKLQLWFVSIRMSVSCINYRAFITSLFLPLTFSLYCQSLKYWTHEYFEYREIDCLHFYANYFNKRGIETSLSETCFHWTRDTISRCVKLTKWRKACLIKISAFY